jgi:hypothetical protein
MKHLVLGIIVASFAIHTTNGGVPKAAESKKDEFNTITDKQFELLQANAHVFKSDWQKILTGMETALADIINCCSAITNPDTKELKDALSILYLLEKQTQKLSPDQHQSHPLLPGLFQKLPALTQHALTQTPPTSPATSPSKGPSSASSKDYKG